MQNNLLFNNKNKFNNIRIISKNTPETAENHEKSKEAKTEN